MVEDLRKKSPRAPSLALDEAIERVFRVYEKERRHAAPADIVAQDIGYKSANNGAALSALASLRYFGLLDRSAGGKLAVTKEVEDYRFAPSEEMKRAFEVRWLRSPPVYAELLDKFEDGLPSDAVLRFELIQKGFTPSSVESVVAAFKRSVEFARPFEAKSAKPTFESDDAAPSEKAAPPIIPDGAAPSIAQLPEVAIDVDRIPIRLSGGRRAWLEIPTPFFEADKVRIKAQIDLLLTEDPAEL